VIAFVSGQVAAFAADGVVVVEVGGVGLQVQCSPSTMAGLRVGQPARLPTSLVVREDSLTLYGFADDDERGVFERLQTAGGVGPRLAQAMLAVHPPDALRHAVASEDIAALMLVPGIGRKGAQRIALDLKDRLGAPIGGRPAGDRVSATAGGWREQVHGALLGLGYAAREADDAVTALPDPADAGAADVGEQLRAALRGLARR
jgi:Holliday junction DNA helicase RuvA